MNARDADPARQRELATLADELADQAAQIRRQWGAIEELLGREMLDASAEDAPARAGGAHDETARLVAIEMVLSGRSRDDVRSYLRESLGMADVEALVDEVFAEFGT